MVNHNIIIICLVSSEDTYERQAHNTGRAISGRAGNGGTDSLTYVECYTMHSSQGMVEHGVLWRKFL